MNQACFLRLTSNGDGLFRRKAAAGAPVYGIFCPAVKLQTNVNREIALPYRPAAGAGDRRNRVCPSDQLPNILLGQKLTEVRAALHGLPSGKHLEELYILVSEPAGQCLDPLTIPKLLPQVKKLGIDPLLRTGKIGIV